MYIDATVIGIIREVREDGRGNFSVLIDADGKLVAARTFGKSTEAAKKLNPGQIVATKGYVSSREYNGKFFTDFNASFFKTVSQSTAVADDGPF